MNESFFIFLDIDGVLWDNKHLENMLSDSTPIDVDRNVKFNTESINALNFLIKKLEEKYKVFLVISSIWRFDMRRTITALYKSNLTYECIIKHLELTVKKNRAKLISEYLHSENENNNFVIIDDQIADIEKLFSKSHIIQTYYDNCLNKKSIVDFLTQNNVIDKNKNNDSSNFL